MSKQTEEVAEGIRTVSLGLLLLLILVQLHHSQVRRIEKRVSALEKSERDRLRSKQAKRAAKKEVA